MNNDTPWPITNLLFTLFFITLTIFLASCGKSPQTTDVASEQLLQQAKQCDIPVPVGFKPVASKDNISEQNKTVLHYHGNLSTEKITHFYKKSMELNGWNIQDFSTSQEGLLFCNKAHKRCAVSMKQGKIKIVLLASPASKSIRYYATHKPSNIDIINKKEINIS